jgi:leucyl/phenylalanyl-tRNA--protein transferase
MAVFALTEEYIFPDPRQAEKNGLIAVGGDLNTSRLIVAYASGIFPWYSDGDPILWWSPDPRMVLYPNRLKVSKSLRNKLRNRNYKITFDQRFMEVIRQCAITRRSGQKGTWITPEMEQAYIELHHAGFAHSCEVMENEILIGGLYGLSLGKAFFGESMFHKKPDASKIALYYLVQKLVDWDFHFIDAQVETKHMKSLGAVNINRSIFLGQLKEALKYPTIKGKW